jgi:hypothetical protein
MCVAFPMQHMIDQFHQSEQFLTLVENVNLKYTAEFATSKEETPDIIEHIEANLQTTLELNASKTKIMTIDIPNGNRPVIHHIKRYETGSTKK